MILKRIDDQTVSAITEEGVEYEITWPVGAPAEIHGSLVDFVRLAGRVKDPKNIQ